MRFFPLILHRARKSSSWSQEGLQQTPDLPTGSGTHHHHPLQQAWPTLCWFTLLTSGRPDSDSWRRLSFVLLHLPPCCAWKVCAKPSLPGHLLLVPWGSVASASPPNLKH